MSFNAIGLVLIISSILFRLIGTAIAFSLDDAAAQALANSDGQFMVWLGIHPVLEQVRQGNQVLSVLNYASIFTGVLGIASAVVGILAALGSVMSGAPANARRRRSKHSDPSDLDSDQPLTRADVVAIYAALGLVLFVVLGVVLAGFL